MIALVRLIGFCALILAIVSGTARADIKFGVAAEPYPPFTSKDASGKWVGWEIDLMDEVCKQMQERCELVEVAWDGIIPALVAKQIDVIWSSMSITDERRKTIDFTDMYYEAAVSVIGSKDQKFEPTAEGLKGKVIGVQVSTTNESYAQKYFATTAKEIKSYQTQDEVNADLFAGRLDAVVADALALGAFLATEQGKACCILMGYVADDDEILGQGTGGGVRKKDVALKEKLNSAIKALAQSGMMEKISERHGLTGMLTLPH